MIESLDEQNTAVNRGMIRSRCSFSYLILTNDGSDEALYLSDLPRLLTRAMRLL